MATELHPRKIGPDFFAPRADTILAWLGMAGVLINARGTVFLIDPLLTVLRRDGREMSESEERFLFPLPIEAKEVPRADAVLYTHADDDHFGPATARTLLALTPLFVAPALVGEKLSALGVPRERMRDATHSLEIPVGTSMVEVTPALHDHQKVNPYRREDCCGYLVKTPDGTIWHPGDTRLIDELLSVRGVDVFFFDVAPARAHLGPEGSAALAKSSGAKKLIAYHYGTFDLPGQAWASSDPEDSLSHLEGLLDRFVILQPGEILRLPLTI
ncbi:MAG: MBL fold metallo-hydrolase [Planctomycetota bacterium]